MEASDNRSGDARPGPHDTSSPDNAREPWTTPTVRVLAASATEGGADGEPAEGTFYGPLS